MAATIAKPVGGKPDKLIRDALLAAHRQSPEKLKKGAEKLWDKFAEGDKDAVSFIADRVDGRAIQTLASDPDNPIVPSGDNLAQSILKSIPTETLTAILVERADDNALGH